MLVCLLNLAGTFIASHMVSGMLARIAKLKYAQLPSYIILFVSFLVRRCKLQMFDRLPFGIRLRIFCGTRHA